MYLYTATIYDLSLPYEYKYVCRCVFVECEYIYIYLHIHNYIRIHTHCYNVLYLGLCIHIYKLASYILSHPLSLSLDVYMYM